VPEGRGERGGKKKPFHWEGLEREKEIL